MIIPNIWKNKTCSKPPTSIDVYRCIYIYIDIYIYIVDIATTSGQNLKKIGKTHLPKRVNKNIKAYQSVCSSGGFGYCSELLGCGFHSDGTHPTSGPLVICHLPSAPFPVLTTQTRFEAMWDGFRNAQHHLRSYKPRKRRWLNMFSIEHWSCSPSIQ